MNSMLTTCSFVSATVIVTSCAFADTWVVDDDGKALPNDGKTYGRLMVKGPGVIER